MNLHSGMPFWVVLNPLYNYYQPVKADFSTQVVIIGSGITGALVAHVLCNLGINCAVIDKRTIATGSTAASTSQLQYEIDVPLHQLIEKVGEKHAVAAYNCCLQSIDDLDSVFKSIGKNPNLEYIPTYYFASNSTGNKILKKEYNVRKAAGLPVQFIDRTQLKKDLNINAPAALYNNTSAQLDRKSTR